jgi:hypothetical protein
MSCERKRDPRRDDKESVHGNRAVKKQILLGYLEDYIAFAEERMKPHDPQLAAGFKKEIPTQRQLASPNSLRLLVTKCGVLEMSPTRRSVFRETLRNCEDQRHREPHDHALQDDGQERGRPFLANGSALTNMH